MPYSSMADAPPQWKKHKNVALTLDQVNHLARIYDALKTNPDIENPAGAAWRSWEQVYKLEGDKWVRKAEGKEDEETKSNSSTSKTYMESVLLELREFDVKESERGTTEIHGVAVTTNASNKQRFPSDVLERDIVTLIGQPLVEGHSDFPHGSVKSKDVLGMITDAWYVPEKKHAEFTAEAWEPNYQRVVKAMPHRVKFSVGFKHNYQVDETGIKVSSEAFFDHLGSTNQPADTGSVLLGIKESLEGRGLKANLEGERTIVVEHSTGLRPEKKGVEEMPEDGKEKEEKENPPKEDQKDKKEAGQKDQPPKDAPKDSKGVAGTTPEPKTPDKKEEEAGAVKALEGRLTKAEDSLKERDQMVAALKEKVTILETERKTREVGAYVDSLVAAGVKTPAQRDALVGHYMTFTPEQMAGEMKINTVSADLTAIFGEKALLKTEDKDQKEKEAGFKEPERKKIT